MLKIYKDYHWKEGAPVGEGPHSGSSGFRIISDPYRKRLSVEQYREERFIATVYDSALFDFRLLKEEAQTAWRKEQVDETLCLIRDQDDRIVVRERYFFEEGRCRSCEAWHPCGILISKQKIFYKELHDSFNGVILYDRIGKVVLKKEYAIDEKSGEFSALLREVRSSLAIA